LIPEVTLGKRCARLDLGTQQGREIFEQLLSQADVLVHGYRPGALDQLGYTETARRAINPGLIDVSLDAYGWSGPWSGRRGFDSLVQMSSGIAHAGMQWKQADRPVPLPVQALDQATGYLMAAAVVRSLVWRITENRVTTARLSLARTAQSLIDLPRTASGAQGLATGSSDFSASLEQTEWGPAKRCKSPVTVNGAALPAGTYGIWTIPDSSSWTIIFSSSAAAFHLRYPEGQDVLRVQSKPQHGDHVETLLFEIPMVDADSATLQLRWGTTIVPLTIRAPR